MLELGRRLKKSGAGSLVMISPHGPVFMDGIAVNGCRVLRGNLKRFGAPGVQFELENDLDLAREISERANKAGIATVLLDEKSARDYNVSVELDHGLLVPLYFLARAGVKLPVVVVYMGLLPPTALYSFGVAIRQALEGSGKEGAVIASGDLSHRLTRDAPAGYNPRGLEFDREIVRLTGDSDFLGIINMDSELAEEAGECGLRPVTIMAGTLDGQAVDSEVLSYEGPFGVGYMVAALAPGPVDPGRVFSGILGENRLERLAKKKMNEGFLPRIARLTLEAEAQGRKYSVPPADVPEAFKKPAGVFVSLKKNGQLRGCIGTILPVAGSIVEETVHNAISAGHHDPRFSPVDPGELDELDISVDVLGSPEPVKGVEDLDPVRYGVIVKSGRKRGLLLPNLEGVNTVEEQVDIARQKAGIAQGEPVDLERFEVVRYK
ncbi:MAG: AmmeMemoRadiSam system protein A, partial [Desulfocucumaceae bacterium]